MIKRITIFILVIAVLALSLLMQGTFAWFTDVALSNQTYQIGAITYVFSGSLATVQDNQIVVPGQPLITNTNLFLTNQSNIDTNLRLQIRFTYTDQITHLPVETIYNGTGQLNNFMDLSMVTNWVYDVTDQCWHYKYNNADNIPASTTVDGYAFAIITNITFDGAAIDNTLSGSIFKLKLIFQAKQANYVTWQTIGTQDIVALAG